MNEAAWEASKALLLPCKNCGRRFAADRLPVHMKSCKETKPGIASPAQSDHHKLEVNWIIKKIEYIYFKLIILK